MIGEGLPVEGGTKELVPLPRIPSSRRMLEDQLRGMRVRVKGPTTHRSLCSGLESPPLLIRKPIHL